MRRRIVRLGRQFILGVGLEARVIERAERAGGSRRSGRNGRGHPRRVALGKASLAASTGSSSAAPTSTAAGGLTTQSGARPIWTARRENRISRRTGRPRVLALGRGLHEGAPTTTLQFPGAIEVEKGRRRGATDLRVVTLERGHPENRKVLPENDGQQQRVDGLNEQARHAGRSVHLSEAGALTLDRVVAGEESRDELLARGRNERGGAQESGRQRHQAAHRDQPHPGSTPRSRGGRPAEVYRRRDNDARPGRRPGQPPRTSRVKATIRRDERGRAKGK